MSIILEALKKAQKKDEKNSSADQVNVDLDASASSSSKSSGVFQPKADPFVPKNSNIRLIVLVGLVVVGLGFASLSVYRNFVSSGDSSADVVVPAVKPIDTTVAQNMAEKNKLSEDEKKKKDYSEQASLLFQTGKFEEATKAYEKLKNLEMTAENLNNYGVALKRAGKLQQARQAYEEALNLKFDYPEALNNLAVVDLIDRKYLDAKSRFKQAIEINPEYLDPYLHLALCLERLGEVSSAKDYYRSYLQLSEGKVDRNLRLQVENRLSRLIELHE